ncbi:adenosylmethionine--8-amino-7-oxononanoate transaminase [Roseateles saccharophilus]|uniref:Adenosylmethionine-8-amino-7-oxononanoate aminotransferase n=2 Tax=Roseateles saccharophilus TaxID=304 RepID=A0A4R3V0M3_ROSSA|nr:adenosylmethionine--8-amino-7-oxononanoate transaminase [Roseateles saccharophilus]TCU97060.1 adenosylmethionine-8-amino-7-oxononanoate aminotransferase [Roseateles saccharophilus]
MTSRMTSLQDRSRQAVWHPCTQMARLDAVPPLPIAHGEGPWLFDTDGNRYFDANSSWWVNLFGHSDKPLHDAIKAQLDTLPHVMLAGCTHEPAVRLAERLSARTGGALGHVFFGSDGASAVEIALKQSFHSWKNRGHADKREFVCLKNSYHGETLGALSVTDVQVFRDAYDPLLLRSHIVASPDGRLGNEAEALAAMRALLAERYASIACVIVEPLVQGAAGMVMYSPGYLKGLRELTREFGVHLIADEIAVGCGRTGSFFAWEQSQADWPDFLLLSKGITGGTMALSLVLTTDDVFAAFWSEDVTRGFLHSHSYTGNPLACAAANAVLDRFDAGQLDANRAQAERLTRAFAPLSSRVSHLRQRGMILAFDVPEAPPRFAEAFHLKAREHELLIRPIGSTVYLMPPYLIDDATAAFLAGAVTATLNDVLA